MGTSMIKCKWKCKKCDKKCSSKCCKEKCKCGNKCCKEKCKCDCYAKKLRELKKELRLIKCELKKIKCTECSEQPHHECHDHCDGVFVFKDCSIPFTSARCNNPFNLRLAGLNQNLNFQLMGTKGCQVEIEYECQGTNGEVKGTVCNIGTDFIDVKSSNGVVSTILKERICKINWKDPCCNPCSCECHDDHGIHMHCQNCGCHGKQYDHASIY